MEKLCTRCGVKFASSNGVLPGNQHVFTGLDQYQRVFIRVYYKDCLCPSCTLYIKDNFYAFDISSAYLKNK
ncbi:hypothetical protein [Parabacteroides timonensis]|uniref:hypothetical protein n=1 Tax=Parabacteroides timonensis TaxID=1871013 RepID=UPI00094ED67D|nr:hypothetical protein [Parabacteroides timonensis]